ncbi:amidase family protein [Curtobacterium sp. 9128]|uniref:amidase family protein n=1 Tax=Curtobacterium sp. 9128 TaxID=1793722 RepID=UPI0021B384EE|nr:amidase family protein [Curtobacterium sp. 9128]
MGLSGCRRPVQFGVRTNTVDTVDTGNADAAPSDLRVAWFTDSGLGPVDPQVADTVRQAAAALANAGVHVEEIDIPTLHHDNPLALFNKQHVMELKPAMAEATEGHEDLRFTMSTTMLATPDTSIEDYVAAEQGFERIRDAYAEVFTTYDAVLLPVLPIPAHEHDKTEFVIDGQTVDATHIQTFTVQFNITGMPALSMRFGTSSDGLPIGVQIAGPWHAETTVFNVAKVLESVSPVRDQHPEI